MSLPIRTRLTIWFTALVFLGAGAVAAFLYIGFGNSVDVFMTEHLHHESVRIERLMRGATSADELLTTLDRVVGPQQHGYDFYCRILDRDEKTLLQSPPDVPLSFPIPPDIRRGARAGLATVPAPGNAGTLRVFTTALPPDLCTALADDAYLQIAQPTEMMTDRLRTLRRCGALGVAFVVTFFAIAGYFLIRKALQPVSAIAAHASAIGASDLARRLPRRDTNDELDELAAVLNEMFERLETAFVRNRRFAAAAAHQLRTPLTGLRGNLEMLNREAGIDGRLDDVLADVDRMVALCRRMLLWTKVSEGAGPSARADWSTVDVRELCHDLTVGARATARRAGVQVVLDAPDEPMTVEGSATLLGEAVHNLIDNAIRHSPRGGTVRVGVARDDRGVDVVVRDDGPGIPADAADAVFRHFERAHGLGDSGFGLGLPIARGIVRSHGGDLTLERPGTPGATFRIQLPA